MYVFLNIFFCVLFSLCRASNVIDFFSRKNHINRITVIPSESNLFSIIQNICIKERARNTFAPNLMLFSIFLEIWRQLKYLASKFFELAPRSEEYLSRKYTHGGILRARCERINNQFPSECSFGSKNSAL